MRSSSHAPTLNAQLVAWGLSSDKASRLDIAEHLASGLSVADCLALHDVVSMPKGSASPAHPIDVAALRRDVAGARDTLAALVDDLLQPGEDEVAFSLLACQQRYTEVQRHMGVHLEAIHQRFLDTMAMASPQLAQLARLDAFWMQALSTREHKAFASIPGLLAKRFAQRCPYVENARRSDGTPDADAYLMFMQDARRMALTELDMRMQPVLGLLDTLEHTHT